VVEKIICHIVQFEMSHKWLNAVNVNCTIVVFESENEKWLNAILIGSKNIEQVKWNKNNETSS
jgi:hypothetical protein